MDSYYTTYIGVRDKTTGLTRLIQAKKMLLRPQVTAPPTTNPVLLKVEETEVNPEDRTETNKNLIKAFGQRKGQRYYENREALAVDSAETEARVLKAAGSVNADDLTATPEAPKLNIIPPRDETAGRADLVYRVEHLLTEREVEDLIAACTPFLEHYNSVEALEEGEKKRQLSKIGVFFFTKLLDNPDHLDNKAALMMYMDAIVKFTKLRPNDIAKGQRALPAHLPNLIKKKIFDTFSMGIANKRMVTPELKDKAICYILVLALMLSNCQVDLSLITQSVRVDSRNLKKLVLMTGANLEQDALTGQQKIILRKTLAKFDPTYVSKKRKT